MVVSCGVILLNDRRQVFTCRATGTQRWDLPKGVNEPGEDPRATAVREAWEESGVFVPGAALHDVGEFAYLPGKRLHLFALRVAIDAIDLAACRCRSYFPHHRTRRPTPEADAYAFHALDMVSVWCGKNMARVLSALPWDALDALPEVAALDVDKLSPVGP